MAFFFLHLYRLRSRRTAGGFFGTFDRGKNNGKEHKILLRPRHLIIQESAHNVPPTRAQCSSVVHYDRFGMDNHILYDS